MFLLGKLIFLPADRADTEGTKKDPQGHILKIVLATNTSLHLIYIVTNFI